MASSSFLLVFFYFTILIFVCVADSGPITGCFKSIISFGDSLSDTGNKLIELKGDAPVGRFPYGETYFHHPTGRYCDGRLILDFIAQALRIPRVPPSLGKGNFRRGLNFATTGATAINTSFFDERKLPYGTNLSLAVQVEMFRKILPSIRSDSKKFLSESLIFVGEIGGIDYLSPLYSGMDVESIRSDFVPRVVEAIGAAIDLLVEIGAKKLVVPGFLPYGCSSGILTVLQSNNSADYDPETKCIKRVNELVEYHNEQLKQEVDQSCQRHPSAAIVYADYYTPTINLFRDPNRFGFGQDYLSACCGGGGPYNYQVSISCGTEGATLCTDPSKYIIWDGLHFTEAAYKAISDDLLHGPSSFIRINQTCP